MVVLRRSCMWHVSSTMKCDTDLKFSLNVVSILIYLVLGFFHKSFCFSLQLQHSHLQIHRVSWWGGRVCWRKNLGIWLRFVSKSQLHYLLATWPWKVYPTLLLLNSLLSKMGIPVPFLQVQFENKVWQSHDIACKLLKHTQQVLRRWTLSRKESFEGCTDPNPSDENIPIA